jgi:hypothetical protein
VIITISITVCFSHLPVLQAISELYWMSTVQLQEWELWIKNVSHQKLTFVLSSRAHVFQKFLAWLTPKCQVPDSTLRLSLCPGVKYIFSKHLHLSNGNCLSFQQRNKARCGRLSKAVITTHCVQRWSQQQNGKEP